MYTAKGAILAASAPSTVSAQPVGANDTVLTADSAQTRGMKWVKVGDSMILAGSNLAKLSGVTGTPNGTKLFRDDGSWQNILDNMVAAGTNLAKLSAVTGTPTGAKFLRDDGSWQTPAGGGGSLTYAINQLTGDVTISGSNTYADAMSVSLAAGTWLLGAVLTVLRGANASRITAKLWDGTTVIATGEGIIPTAGDVVSIPLLGIVVLGSTTTYKVSAAGTSSGNIIKATAPDNGAGNTASTLVGLKIA
jgi:hypothetical protein